uniref:Guanine nucleotide-binding protein subunit gamma n=1 Tax=Plectus sambesii TaxID=2011161 RepID=A0A914WAH2_9BILA
MSGRDRHSVQQVRKTVEQLRRERNMRREPISQRAHDLIQFVRENQRDDVLLLGFPNDKMNPYRPKSSFSCDIL